MFFCIRGSDSASTRLAEIGRGLQINTDGTFSLITGSGTNCTPTKTVSVGEPVVIFAWGKDYDILALDIKGEVATFNNSSGWGGLQTVITIGGDLSFGSSNHSVIAYAKWDRYLTYSERDTLRNNPWQILEPEIIPLFYSTITAQYARPTSDVSAGGWTASTGSDLFAMLDETSANDSDYITTTSASTCEVALGSITDPAVSTGHIVRYRLSADAGGITVRLRQGTTTIATWTHAPAPASLTLYEQTLSSGEANSITDYTALRLQFEATA